MCGICGKLNFSPEHPVDPALIESMMHTITHRGPDAQGTHVDGQVGLGHLRLSIIDLSSLGAQPMCNEDRSVWIVFNGEIYNFQDLRRELAGKGHQFRSSSDTEVIIHAYEEYGPDCLQKLRGMFAFAIWDSNRKILFVARDRVGIKPLYYHYGPNSLLFGSEMKSILADPCVPRDIDLDAVRSFFSFHYVPGEQTLFKSIRKLLPGHYMLLREGHVSIRRYWDLSYSDQRRHTSFEEASEELYHLLHNTVRDHMIADVPVGVLLSGGVDSTAVLSFAVKSTGRQVNTFTVGFDAGTVVDERPYARSAAAAFGSLHHEITISAKQFWDFLPTYVWHMEEPVHEPPAVALYYVSKLARQHVKVVLSGEGGDEAFAGYPNYPNMLKLQRLESRLNGFSGLLRSAAHLVGSVAQDDRILRYAHAIGRPMGEHYFSRTSSPASFFNSQDQRLFTHDFLEATNAEAASAHVTALLKCAQGASPLNQMLYVDTKTWLPDDLLVKADKMTMANSLELRVPLLDHVVLEFAASLPDNFKVEGGSTKRLLKSTFARAIPSEILHRKKAGFPVPYSTWLSGELKHDVEDVLLSSDAVTRGYVKSMQIEAMLDNRSENFRPCEVFCLLSLELWHNRFASQFPRGGGPNKPANRVSQGSCSFPQPPDRREAK